MKTNFIVRQITEADYSTVYNLIKTAFETAEHRDGDEQDFAVNLRNSYNYIPELDLVAEWDGELLGHIMFTKTFVAQPDGSRYNTLMVAPLAVLLEYRSFGVGSALMKEGLRIAQTIHNLRDGLPFPYTPEDAKAFIEIQANEPSLTCYGIVVDGKVVGNIGFTRNYDVERFSAEVEYYIGEEYWNKGIMSSALARAVDDYFSTTDIIRLYATPFGHNQASARVLEKAGFTFTCTMTKAAYKNGQFTDELYFEKLNCF